MGSIGIVFVAVVASVLLGAVLGGVLVLVKHRLGWGGPDKDAEHHISLQESVGGHSQFQNFKSSQFQHHLGTPEVGGGSEILKFGNSEITASAKPSCCP